MAKTSVVKASELGDNWNARKHIKVEVTVEDLEKLADLRSKRNRLLKALNRLNDEEKEILKKYLEVV